MHYEKIIRGTFIDRPNRFIAHVNIEGNIETVHVKNTGRCKELLLPGSDVILEDFRNRKGFENRKTKFDLIAVYKKLESGHPLYSENQPEILINMDSQLPNKVVLEWLKQLPAKNSFSFIKPEFKYGKSRVDFYMEKATSLEFAGETILKTCENQRFLMEVKGCTLEKNGIGYFPDAPTERGVKHLHELTEATKQGFKCFLAFVIQIPDIKMVLPNHETHPEFSEALEEARLAGVEIIYLQCDVDEADVKIKNPNYDF